MICCLAQHHRTQRSCRKRSPHARPPFSHAQPLGSQAPAPAPVGDLYVATLHSRPLPHYSYFLSLSYQHYSNDKRARRSRRDTNHLSTALTPRQPLAQPPTLEQHIVDVLHAAQPRVRKTSPPATRNASDARSLAESLRCRLCRAADSFGVFAGLGDRTDVGTACLPRGSPAPSNSLTAAQSKRLTQRRSSHTIGAA